jgi:acetaldehyde dehydrogenase (acetylating)
LVGRESTKKLPNNVPYYSSGIQFFIDNPRCCDIVFDCTDAYSATKNATIFLEQGIIVIDMTPSKIGRMCVPNVNCECLTTCNKCKYGDMWWSGFYPTFKIFDQ